MFYSRNENEPLIDMICRVNGGYDATIRESHDGETEKIRTLAAALDLARGEKLRIFYGVPSCRYGKFEISPAVNPLLLQPDLDNVFLYHVSVMANV